MDSVAIFCTLMGVLYVVSRLPMAIAPKATMRWTRESMFSSNARTRAFGIGMAPIAPALLLLPFGEGLVPLILRCLGGLIALALLGVVLAPGIAADWIRGLYEFLETTLSEGVLRGLAIFGVVFGLVLIYVGIFVL
ncbi:MAG TPA: hypothetical protein EYQ54_16485 [Myxococcales bacterium]|nr:hypothetical protein [Myxococcales bacterium]